MELQHKSFNVDLRGHVDEHCIKNQEKSTVK